MAKTYEKFLVSYEEQVTLRWSAEVEIEVEDEEMLDFEDKIGSWNELIDYDLIPDGDVDGKLVNIVKFIDDGKCIESDWNQFQVEKRLED